MRKKSIFAGLAMVICLFMAGCANQKFLVDGERATIPTYEGTHHFFIGGILQSKDVYPNEVCGEKGISAVETNMTFLNGFLGGLTMGIYTPRQYYIYCKK